MKKRTVLIVILILFLLAVGSIGVYFGTRDPDKTRISGGSDDGNGGTGKKVTGPGPKAGQGKSVQEQIASVKQATSGRG